MSTRGGVSAFGVVHKSEYERGRFKPVTQMSADERTQARSHALNGPRRRSYETPSATRHNLASVYGRHGYSFRGGEMRPDPKSTPKLKQEFDPRGHTPSQTHPKIAYGHSVTPEMRAKLDQHLDPKLAGKLRHTVVFHHDPAIHPAIHGAAVPAHTTTGGRGHVVLGQPFKAGSQHSNSYLRGVVNHELVHADIKHPPRQNLTQMRNVGEEARADAKSGAQAYLKNRIIPGRGTTRLLAFASRATSDGIPGVKESARYHKVQDNIRRSGASNLPSSGRKLAIKAGAGALVAGGGLLVHHQKKEKS